jgi:putative tryptophan/tyrosine transport system ATP-binding protein
MTQPILSLRGVTKYFLRGTPNAVKALDRIHLAVEPGDFVSIIGSNGAGKSTLIKAVAGLAVPDEGTITFEGRDITRVAVHRRAAAIGRIAQDPGESTCAIMTIEENLAMAAKRGQARGLRRAVTEAGRARYRAALAPIGLGLEARLSARTGTLSGGQRQALALLMATISGSRLLLLDEHVANLDPKTAEIVMALTDRLVLERKLTTLMITHNMQDAIRWGNRLLMMHAGRIIFDARGEAKAALTVAGLVARFHEASQGDLAEDRVLLAG